MPYNFQLVEDRRRYFRDRYKTRKLKLIKLLGGKCKECGETETQILELDHINSQTKSYNFNYLFMISESNPKYQEEIKKLQVLCERCHTKKSSEEQRKLFCKNGHPRIPGQTVSKSRVCLICQREHSRKYKKFKKLGSRVRS